MTQDKIKRIHRIYGLGLTVILIIIGALVILSCLDLYGGMRGSYTPEAIASHYQSVSIPIYIGIAGIVGGIILNMFLPLPRQRTKSLITPRETMLRMRQKVSGSPVKKEQKLRLLLIIVTSILFIALMIYPVIYLLTPGHFSREDPNPYVIKAAIVVFVPTLIGLAICWCCQLLLNASYKRETSINRDALISGHRSEKVQEVNNKFRFNMRWIQLPLILLAVFFIVIGVMNKGADDVLLKAVAICTECIGIG